MKHLLPQTVENAMNLVAQIIPQDAPIAVGTLFYRYLRNSPHFEPETTKAVLMTRQFGMWKTHPVFIIPGSQSDPEKQAPRAHKL
jgi:hypothetical protein